MIKIRSKNLENQTILHYNNETILYRLQQIWNTEFVFTIFQKFQSDGNILSTLQSWCNYLEKVEISSFPY